MIMMILMMIIIIVIIMTTMIMMIEIILIVAVVMINSPFQLGDFSTGSTADTYQAYSSFNQNKFAEWTLILQFCFFGVGDLLELIFFY